VTVFVPVPKSPGANRGLILGIALGPDAGGGASAQPAPFTPNAFIRIATDGRVTFTIPKSEMGQGVYTALPMLIAEELGCAWESITVEPAPVESRYNHTRWQMMNTGGSSSTWSEWDRLSLAGATAREMLVAAAAKTWKVDKKNCNVENGKIISSDGRSLKFGELAETAAQMEVPRNVRLKDPKDRKILGKPRLCLDNPAKVNGTALYGIDYREPGMLTAVIARPPVFGGRLKTFDAEKAKQVPDVRDIIPVPAGVAVIATGFAQAEKARKLLKISWDDGGGSGISTEGMRDEYRRLAATPGLVARRDGDPEKAIAAAEMKITAEYEVPFLAHSAMEPLNAAVVPKEGSCDIWVGTQSQTRDRNSAAAVLGLLPEKVRLHTLFLGGGFGRRANPAADFVTQAAEVAKAVRQPVKVIWSREDDMRGGFYRPMWFDRLSAGLDGNKNLVAWQHTIVGQSIMAGTPMAAFIVKDGIDETSVEGARELPYAVPHIRVDLHTTKNPVPVQWWRSVGHSHTAFVVESFLDEIAHAAGKDPLAIRRELLQGMPRHLGVVNLAAGKAGWDTPLPDGRARGIALAESFGSFVAQVAEVSVDTGGNVKVHRVVCAVDCGKYVNPDSIAAQMEGGIVFGLSAALHGEITLKDGKVGQSNFNNYPVLRMPEMPRVEVHIVESSEKPGGIGEPGVPPIAPAVCNAIFSLTGKRVRKLPIRPEMLRAG